MPLQGWLEEAFACQNAESSSSRSKRPLGAHCVLHDEVILTRDNAYFGLDSAFSRWMSRRQLMICRVPHSVLTTGHELRRLIIYGQSGTCRAIKGVWFSGKALAVVEPKDQVHLNEISVKAETSLKKTKG